VRNDFHFILHYRLSERVQELTVGFWQDAYKGDVGRLVFGIQYGNFKLNGDPNQGLNPNNHIFMTSARHYPFQ
jgi:hypothetical protein